MANTINENGSNVSIQAMSHNIIFSTPEFVPSDDACLTSTQVAYNIEEAPPFEEIAPYLVEEGEDYIDADTVWNNLMPQAASVPDNRTRVYSTNTSPYNRIGLVVAWYDNNENGKFTLLINSETITEKNEAIVITFKVKENVTGDVTISIVDLVGATSEDKKINWDGLTATVKVDGNNNEQNGNNNNEGNNENNDGNNTENNNENDNIGNGGNNSEENGNNNGNINNDNNGEHVQNNENNDSNNGNIENNNIGNNNNDSENDVNNTDKKPSKNEENLAPGKLPQTGNNLFMYIINMAVFLIVAILIVLYIRSKINKEK